MDALRRQRQLNQPAGTEVNASLNYAELLERIATEQPAEQPIALTDEPLEEQTRPPTFQPWTHADYYAGVAIPRPSFWEGAARLLDFPGLLGPHPPMYSDAVNADWRALAGDWQVVGQEIRIALEQGLAQVQADPKGHLEIPDNVDVGGAYGSHRPRGAPSATPLEDMDQHRQDLADELRRVGAKRAELLVRLLQLRERLDHDRQPTSERSATRSQPEYVTDRERQILRLIAAGRTNHEIGAEMKVSIKTVESHVAHILSKLNASDRTRAAIRAIELGIVERTEQ